MPDGAKFCQNCGALTASAAEKNFCESCGLELPKGAKFCTVCGAAVSKTSTAEVKPSDVLAPVTPIEPVSIAPAADLTKAAEEIGNSAVSITANEQPAYSIPEPSSDFSMPEINTESNEFASAPTIFEQSEFGYIPEAPVIEEAPAIEEIPAMPETPVMPAAPVMPETPVASVTPVTPVMPAAPEPTGYSAAAASYGAPTAAPAPTPTVAPTYAPAPNVQPENPFGNYGMGAAAVTAKPIKKKNALKPILITLGAILGAALIAAGVLFFVNKSFLFNLVLGNSGYAAMVEGNSIKDITNNIDVGAMSQGIKSATNSIAGTLTQMSNYSSGIVTTSVKPMMYSTSIDPSSVDFKTLVNQLGNIMRETYGANSANISVDFDAELTDTALSQLPGLLNCSSKDIEEVLKLINNSGFSVEVTADGKALESTVEMTNGSLKINAKTVVTENGDAYLVLPFVSEKAFMMKIGTGYTASAGQVSNVCLELDEKELKRIIDKLVSIYIDVYKSGEIEVRDGEISVSGVTAKGKYITTTLKGSNFADLFKRIIDAFANDSYLCQQLSKFFGECGMPVTDAQIKSTLQSMTKAINIPDDAFKLVVETVTDNSCRVLAKSYSIVASNKAMKISAVGDLTAKDSNTAALAVEIDQKPIAALIMEKTSETDGVCTVTIYNDNSSVSAKIKYSGVKKTTFNGKPFVEGTYEISMVLPADFTGAENADEISALISSAKIIMSVTAENDSTIKETVSFELQQYGKISATALLTISDKANGVEIPSDVIDITDAVGTNTDKIPESLKNDVISYVKDVKNAVKNQNGGELGKALEEALNELINVAENGPSADISDIQDLILDISEEMNEVMEFDEKYQNENEKLSNLSKILVQKYESLIKQISENGLNMTEKQFDNYNKLFAMLTEEKDALEKNYQQENPNAPIISGSSKADEIDFSTLDVTSLSQIFAEYVMRYDAVQREHASEIANNYELNALANEVNTIFETACDDFDNLMDVYKAGSLNLSLLRKSRKSTNTFALAVEALEQATAAVV